MLFSYFQIVILNLLKQEKENAFCDNVAVGGSEFKLLMAVRAAATHYMRACEVQRETTLGDAGNTRLLYT